MVLPMIVFIHYLLILVPSENQANPFIIKYTLLQISLFCVIYTTFLLSVYSSLSENFTCYSWFYVFYRQIFRVICSYTHGVY